MTSPRLPSFLALALLAFAACGGKHEPPSLHVTAHAPSGEIHDERANLRISFDRPVAAETEVGQALAQVPVKISPSLPVTGHWLDRQTLVLTPTTKLARATRYTVELSGELAERAGGYRYDFVHAPLAVQGLTGVSTEWVPRKPQFNLVLNQPISAGRVVEHCRLEAKDGERTVALRTSDATLLSTRIPLETAETLTLGGAYELRCADLVPEGGNAGLSKPWSTPLRVHPAFGLTEVLPKSEGKVTPDELTLRLTFKTPVPEEQLARHVRLEPKNKTFRGAWVQRDATSYEMEVNLEAETNYTLRVDAGLEDRFGQKLGKAQTHKFTTTDASPSLSVESGVYAVEASAEGYPVWTRNVRDYQLACAAVPEKQLVRVLTGDVTYSPWMYEGKTEQLDFKALGLTPKRTVIKPQSTKNKWQKAKLELGKECGGKKQGVFLAEFRSAQVEDKIKARGYGSYPYRVLGNVTDLGVLLKVSPASGLVWVSSLSKAEPVGAAQVSVYDTRGKKVWSGQTDDRGLATLPGAEELRKGVPEEDTDPFQRDSWHETYRDQRVIVVVKKGEDLAVVDGNWSDGIQSWNFGLDTDHGGGQVRVRGFIESDRGIYRPGESVFLKGLAREVPMSGAPRVPEKRAVKVHVEDSQGTAVLDKDLTLTEFGGFDLSVALDEGAATGDYYVTAMVSDQTFRASFMVEEIKPVSFEVVQRTPSKDMRLGTKLKLPFEAHYLFGAPVVDGKVSYEIQRRPHWVHFEAFEEYGFVDWSDMSDWSPWWEPGTYDEFVSEGDARTDKQGRFQVPLHDPTKGMHGVQDYLVRATVRDEADAEVSKRVVVTAHPSDFYLGIRTESWVGTVQKPLAVQMVAVTPDGKQTDAAATLSLSRERWVCDERKDGYYMPCERHLDALWSRPVKLSALSAALESVVPDAPGEYALRLLAKDKRGVEVSTATSLWVAGTGDYSWGDDRETTLRLIASKKQYDPGDVATIVPQADLRGASVLVTRERNGIVDAQLAGAEVAEQGIRIPLDATHAPNVYVSVAMVKPRRGPKDDDRPSLRLGVVNLPVSFEQKRLRVEVTTEKSDFEPGEQVKGKVRVLAADGTPVHAEVALSAADEGVLQLVGYQTPNPLDAFYKPWGLGTDNASNWTRVARLEHAPIDAEGEEGADGAGQDRVRSRFVASAYWAPALVTDAHGEAAFSFTAPDNLTAFRLMAAVADAGDRFGAAEQRIRVRKDLLIAPVAPRFFTPDDEVELGAVVHNYTANAGEVTVHFLLTGLTPAKKTIKLKLEPNGKATARFKAKVGKTDQATLEMRAQLAGAKDALRQTLPILHPSVTDYQTVLEGRSERGRADAMSWPDQLDVHASGLEVLVDRVGLADLGPSLKYLIHYPYGCLEQTMSRLVPLLKVRELAKSLALKELEGPKLESYVTIGVAKVVRHQHADGHFSLWPDSPTYPHLTAYALWGLNEARRAGVKVPERTFDLGKEALRNWANEPARSLAPGDESATMAMAAYVLADLGTPEPALTSRLFEARKALPAYGKAFLLRAMLKEKKRKADVDVLAAELLAQVVTKDGKAALNDPLEPDAHYFSSETRSIAMVVSALLELGGQAERVEALVRGLRARRSGSVWQSTQDNVYGLVAIADYARSESKGKAEVIVRAGDRVLGKRILEGGAVLRIRVPLEDLVRGSPLTVESDSPVYYTAVLEQVKPEPFAKPLDRGFVITRQYLDERSGAPVGALKVGDLVRVRLQVRNDRVMNYVAISDPIPAGFEPVNGKLATERGSDAEPYWGFWNHRDLRDERADWFVDVLGAGEHTLDYTLRATHAGLFVAPPTRAEEMYAPSVMGHTDSRTLTVTR